MMTFLSKKEFKIFLMFFLIYVTFAQLSGWSARSRIDLPISMVYNHTLAINSLWTIPPFNTFSIFQFNNNIYSHEPPGDSFLALPIVALFKATFGYPTQWHFKWLLIYLMVISVSCISGALTCVILYKALRFYTREEKTRMWVTFAYGLGTSGIFISTRILGEATAALFGFLSFYLLLYMQKENKLKANYLFLSGLFGGISILCAFESGVITLSCLAFTLMLKKSRIRNVVLFILGLSVALSVLFFYNYKIFNHPLEIGIFHLGGRDTISVFWGGKDFSQESTLSKYLNTFEVIFSEESLADSLKLLFNNVVQLIFFPYRGLLVYSSFIFFSFVGLFYLSRRNKAETVLIIFIFLSLLFFAASRRIWWGGEGLSSRRLAFAMPFLMLPLANLFSRSRYRRIIIVTVILSILIHLVGMQTPVEYGFFYNLRDSVIKNTILCMYQIVSIPITDFYLPLFLKFGPRSFFIENMLGKNLPPFLNIFLLSFVALGIWYNELKITFFRQRKLFLVLLVTLLILSGFRIAFSSEITQYTAEKLNAYWMEKKQCKPLKPNLLTSPFLLDYNLTSRIYNNFTTPSVLKVDSSLPLEILEGKNWTYPDTDSIPAMTQDATIEIVNNNANRLNVSLSFETALIPYLYKYSPDNSLEIYANGDYLNTYNLTGWSSYNETLTLKSGKNELLFHSVNGCKSLYEFEPVSKELICISFMFKKIQINSAS